MFFQLFLHNAPWGIAPRSLYPRHHPGFGLSSPVCLLELGKFVLFRGQSFVLSPSLIDSSRICAELLMVPSLKRWATIGPPAVPLNWRVMEFRTSLRSVFGGCGTVPQGEIVSLDSLINEFYLKDRITLTSLKGNWAYKSVRSGWKQDSIYTDMGILSLGSLADKTVERARYILQQFSCCIRKSAGVRHFGVLLGIAITPKNSIRGWVSL